MKENQILLITYLIMASTTEWINFGKIDALSLVKTDAGIQYKSKEGFCIHIQKNDFIFQDSDVFIRKGAEVKASVNGNVIE